MIGNYSSKRLFPLFPTLCIVLVAILGHFSGTLCLSGLIASSPTWFFTNYLVTLYPFLAIYPPVFTNNPVPEEPLSLKTFFLFFVASYVVSLVEAVMGYRTQSQSVSWASGYSLHVLSILLFILYHYHVNRTGISQIVNDPHVGSTTAFAVTVLSVLFQFLSNWSYTEARHNFFQNLVIYLLLPFQFFIIFAWDGKRPRIKKSYGYLVFYSVLGMRVPNSLAFGCVRLLARSQVVHHDLIRYLVSFLFLACMTLYIRMLTRVVEYMCPSGQLYARFLFHSQFYTYACYYVLLSTVTKFDGWFFVMILGMNVYYVGKHTGGMTHFYQQQEQAQLELQIKLAEQDVLADHTSLFAVPVLISVFSLLASWDANLVADRIDAHVVTVRVEHYDGTSLNVSLLWVRFAVMFACRWLSLKVSKRILQSRMVTSEEDEEENGLVVKNASSPPRPHLLEVPQVTLYFALVAVHSLYSIFQNPELPARYAFCSFVSLEHT